MRSPLILSSLGFAALAIAAPLEPRNNGGLTVYIPDGTLTGVKQATYNQDLFLGIPYAQPPVGDLRLKPPQPLNGSLGDVQATQYGPHCWDGYTTGFDDNSGFTNSEDCLTLNVIRPSGTKQGDNLPVMFWIHGGGLRTGGSADYRYNASGLVAGSVANNAPIIFVGINYRLGPFGFTANKPLADEGSLNVGFLDQRLALQWVAKNIASFGGDPSTVTIQGESAGGLSVNAHLVAYGGQNNGLFNQAISESGGYFSTFIDPYAQAQQNVLAYTLGNSSCASTVTGSAADQLACLRSLSAEEFRNASASVAAGFARDGTVFSTNSISASYKGGQYARVCLLIGDNTDEGTSFGPRGINTTDQAYTALGSITPQAVPTEYRNGLLDLYPNDPALGSPYNTGDFQLSGIQGGALYQPGAQNKRLASIAGDRFTAAGDRLVAQVMSADRPVYKYRFNHVPWNISYSKLDYIGHFLEVSYVFNLQNDDRAFWNQYRFTATYLGEGAPIADRFLGEYMSRSWASFVATGDPNNANVTTKVHWPNYQESQSNIVFQTQGSVVEQDKFRAQGIQYMIDNLFV